MKWWIPLALCLALTLPLHSTANDKPKDYYSILGVPKSAGAKEIKKAFRRLAKIHHPDKHADQSKAKHEAIFREVAEV